MQDYMNVLSVMVQGVRIALKSALLVTAVVTINILQKCCALIAELI